jgi:hypothetical protein
MPFSQLVNYQKNKNTWDDENTIDLNFKGSLGVLPCSLGIFHSKLN